MQNDSGMGTGAGPVQLVLAGDEIFGAPGVSDKIERKRRQTAEAVARLVAARSEIGDLPDVVDPERRRRCEADVVEWIETYCPTLLRHRMPVRLQGYVRQIVAHADAHAGKTQIIVPRGGGKTSCGLGAILYLTTTGRTKFIVILGAKAAMASSLLKNAWRVLERSQPFFEDYPHIAYPIRALRGAFQRTVGQTYHGVQTSISKTASEIVLPTIDGSPASGAIILAGGAGCAIRGLLRDDGLRPQMVWLDDIMTRKASTPEASRRLEEWLQADVMGLSGADQGLSAVMACTRIADGDLTAIYEHEHAEWHTISYKLVEQWPHRQDLWDKYLALYTTDLVMGDSTGRRAHEFYLANRAEMDAGADVFDELAFDPKTEASAIERAYRLKVQLGEEAFEIEYQGRIPEGDGQLELKPDDVAKKVNGYPKRTLPRGTLACVAFIDVGTTSKLHYSVVATGPHRVKALVDYATYPEKGSITKKDMTLDQKNRALANALVTLAAKLYTQGYSTPTGKPVRLHALWIDRGWNTETVDAVCARLQQKGYVNTVPVKGFASQSYWQGAKAVVARGNNVDMRRQDDGTLFAAQNSDAFKEETQSALLGEPLTPGSLSIFGTDPREHAALAQQLTGEKLVEKFKTARGVQYRWAAARVGAQNHFLDSTSGAIAAATWYRFLEPDAISTAGLGAGTRHRSTAATKRAARRSISPKTAAKLARAARLAAIRNGVAGAT